MSYDPSDLRSQLTATRTEQRRPGACFPPQYFEFLRLVPDDVTPRGTHSWFVRSQNCCVNFSVVHAGDSLARVEQPDEYMVLFPSPDSAAVITAGGDREEIRGSSIAVIPPGSSEVVMASTGPVVRLFSNRVTDLLERCSNADVYDEPDRNVATFEPWPDPSGGHHVRVYRLGDIPADPGRFGRILRSSTLMVNYFYVDDEPRDPHQLSPHHHDDFEQISLQLEGDYVHHIRTPWTVDLAEWRDDEHRFCSSPAVTIIPPPTVHTSQSVGHMRHQLVDIFCPPRTDFSERPGWVLNHDDYPLPSQRRP
jgi:hypothetical protein